MTADSNKLFRMLLDSFREEARERLAEMNRLMVRLETALEEEAAPSLARTEDLHTLYREFHSLKGAARTVELFDIQDLCQAAESLLSAMRQQESRLTQAATSLLLETLDCLETHLDFDGETPGEGATLPSIEPFVARLTQLASQDPTAGAPVTSRPSEEESKPEPELPSEGVEKGSGPAGELAVSLDTVRIRWNRLENLDRVTQELVNARTAYLHLNEEIQRLTERLRQRRREQDHRRRTVTSSRPVESEDCLSLFETQMRVLQDFSRQNLRDLNKTTSALQQELKQVMMLPCASLLDAVPRTVRDLAAQLGKKISVEVEGGEVAVDRRVLETLRTPLQHLLRNSVDHGIERPEERERAGKSRQGNIHVSVTPLERHRIRFRVRDDGRGIDWDAVRDKALERGLIREEENATLSADDLTDLLFESDLSTAPLITDISGRGLGMGIVRAAAERLGGGIAIQSEPGRGAAFEIVVPSAVSSFVGLVVQAGAQSFVLPRPCLETALLVNPAEAQTIGGHLTVTIADRPTPLVLLADVLELQAPPSGFSASTSGAPLRRPALLVSAGGRRVAFLVDALGRQMDIVLKNMGPQLQHVRNIAGLTILGSGELVPVLHPADLVRSALELKGGGVHRQRLSAPETPKSVLIAEDSLTSRTLLKNILKAAGYHVHTAVDGEEALKILRETPVDAVVSDVEMPRMDGFVLTERLRATERFSELPVVLVTSLDKEEQRRRGLEAGADAYIVKSRFDQSNLIETLRKLI